MMAQTRHLFRPTEVIVTATGRWSSAPLSKRLGARELRWVLDNHDQPLWVVVRPGLLTFGVLWALGIFPEGRIMNPLKQYAGVFPGDGFLWVGMGTAFYMGVKYFTYPPTRIWYGRLEWKLLALMLSLALGGAFTSLEINAILHNPHGAATYTWAQFRSPTHLAHLVIIPLMAYITLVAVVPIFVYAKPPRRRWLYKSAIIAGYVGWLACAGLVDNVLRPRPNLADIHPLDGGWLGGWWPGVINWAVHLLG
jgi:hypothetical protein